jgi:hypothetical protein
MRAEEGDESVENLAADAKKTQKNVDEAIETEGGEPGNQGSDQPHKSQ